jgi:hypothetical protein
LLHRNISSPVWSSSNGQARQWMHLKNGCGWMKMNTPTREQVKFHRRVQSAMARAYAPGREERIAAAQAKRDRKAEKRALDAKRTVEGQTLALYRMLSREA